ncbi:hypothetical protein PIB30_101831 [Stylosanthes scabra]|uniref:Uncharacterized protein n=1 Tax=Stylosanthes scabra TaxID=79078 RepID=A0ABU6QWZ6_9FABA|nr:hypothetical protein [Stylosanthes scabra]
MANLKTTQMEFYESILAQQASYGLCLRHMEVKQNDMWVEQSQFHKDVRAYQAQQQEQPSHPCGTDFVPPTYHSTSPPYHEGVVRRRLVGLGCFHKTASELS